MKGSLQDYVKVGIVHFMIYPVIQGEGPILETLKRIIQDDYFETIEISWIKDPHIRQQAKQMLEASGVSLKYGTQPRLLTQKLDLNSFVESERERAVNEVKSGIDEAVELGITDVALLSGSYPGAEQKALAMDLLKQSLVEICLYAETKGTAIALEVFDQKIDKKCLIGQAEDAKEIADRVSSQCNNFGLIVDLSHIPLLGETPAEALRPVAEHLVHVHIGNCYMKEDNDPAFGDLHPRFGYVGGENDVEEIVAFLEELFHVGYLKADGSARKDISFEIQPLGGENPELVIANAKRKLNQAWQQLKVKANKVVS
ncbi:sugar phosphate isomerase/epimerase family protein [Gracilibacillus phocaeensis]|uniref:sugar phosphate isomerase/epimerase family protein n=1 Tax=Gracilibacillus phocaeensis TaxID=2042304 RepID=UPI001031EA6A|nr:sugar phosphate isomerase/epimerase family protein [Gracilibacillus phocaeensis]